MGKGIKRLAVDTENYDPDLLERGPAVRRGGFIAGLAVGVDGGPRWYFPMRHEDGGNLDKDQVIRWAQSELNAFDGELVGASLLYDMDWLAEEGVMFPNV